MTYVRRLKVVGVVLTLVAIITTSHLWGEPAKPVHGKRLARAHNHAPDLADEGFTDDLAESKFAKGGMVTYRTSEGDSLFAVQIKPKLEAAPDRPRLFVHTVRVALSRLCRPSAIPMPPICGRVGGEGAFGSPNFCHIHRWYTG